MAITAATTASSGSTSTSTTITLAAPAGISVGDVLVANIELGVPSGAAPSISGVPSGWTKIVSSATGQPVLSAGYYKVAVAADTTASSYAFTLSAPGYFEGDVSRFTGVDGTTPLDVAGTSATGTAGSFSLPSLTTVTAGAMLVGGANLDDLSTSSSLVRTAPSGWTEPTPHAGQAGAFFLKLTTAAGATGTTTVSWADYSGAAMSGWIGALRPATTAGPSASGSLTLSGTATGAGPISSTGALTLTGTARGSASASAAGALTLSATASGTGAGTGRPALPIVPPVSTADPYRATYSLWYTVDAAYGGSAVAGATGMRPTGGTITDTTAPGVRRTLSLQLASEPGLFDALAPAGTTLTVTAHVRHGARDVLDIPMGVFDVDAQTLDEGGGVLSLTAPDKWVRLQRAKFIVPRSSSPGQYVTQQIGALVQDALGTSEPVNVTASSTAPVTALTWTTDRAQAIIDMATSIGAWCYFDRNGHFTIADIPAQGNNATWLADASASGVMTSLSRSRSRTNTYNVVVIDSNSSDPKNAWPSVVMWDSDPNSPTYAGTDPIRNPGSAAPFGLSTYHYSSSSINSLMAANYAAQAILARTVGLASQVSLEQIPNPQIDAFDTIDVMPPKQRYDIPRVVERHVVDTVTHQLDVSRAQQIQGRSTRVDSYT